MLSQPIPRWILLGAFALTLIAGSVNSVGFLGIHHQALSHMSGTATILSTDLGTGKYIAAGHAGLVLCCFFGGCVLSGIIVRQSKLQMGPRYGVALLIESLFLFVATLAFRQGSYYGDYAASLACGLQNAMATTYSGAIIRTTHITGIVTDLGLAVGHFFRRDPVSRRQVTLYIVLLTGFIFGGLIGTLAFQYWGINALFLPTAVTGIAGLSYAVYRR